MRRRRKARLLPLLLVAVALHSGCAKQPEGSPPEAREESEHTRVGIWPAPRPDDPIPSLGYVSGTKVPDPELRGVVEHDPSATSPGVNLYNSCRESRAVLVSTDGEIRHRWSHEGEPWQASFLLPGGDLLVIVQDERLLLLDKDSRLVWERAGRFHHDAWVDVSDGRIYALTREARYEPAIHPQERVLADAVAVLTPDGELEAKIDILESVRSSPWRNLLPSIYHYSDFERDSSELDILHTNSVQRIARRYPRLPEAFRPGNLLVSIRNLNAIAVIDPEGARVEWLWGPNNLTMQHQPTLLDSGNILLFDNGRSRSRVLEVDPATERIVWHYGPVPGFFTKTRGGAQRLANGNTLITESDEGRVFEVTPEGRVVWDFRNHDVDAEGVRGAIYRLRRFSLEDLSFVRRGEGG